ncbi:MAG: glutamate synthase subunit alpha, partial [Pseudomonadota bacterium]
MSKNETNPGRGLYAPHTEHDACGVGFVVHMKGVASHSIVTNALSILKNLQHRGACGCEENTGDGAGILLQLPHSFYVREAKTLGMSLPNAGHYGCGLVFLPRQEREAAACKQQFETIVREEGQTLLGWRRVPIDDSSIGPTAKAAEPVFEQAFIARAPAVKDQAAFERKLFIIRKRVEHAIAHSALVQKDQFYVPSLSSRTIVYKGMLTPDQVEKFFPELNDPAVASALALVHSRFSTNTFPSWPLAHPYRYIAHNGEINTLRGNINW